jgi:hypothetical protein
MNSWRKVIGRPGRHQVMAGPECPERDMSQAAASHIEDLPLRAALCVDSFPPDHPDA